MKSAAESSAREIVALGSGLSHSVSSFVDALSSSLISSAFHFSGAVNRTPGHTSCSIASVVLVYLSEPCAGSRRVAARRPETALVRAYCLVQIFDDRHGLRRTLNPASTMAGTFCRG